MGVRWSRMSWSEKNELWQRWRRGETLDQSRERFIAGQVRSMTTSALKAGSPHDRVAVHVLP